MSVHTEWHVLSVCEALVEYERKSLTGGLGANYGHVLSVDPRRKQDDQVIKNRRKLYAY